MIINKHHKTKKHIKKYKKPIKRTIKKVKKSKSINKSKKTLYKKKTTTQKGGALGGTVCAPNVHNAELVVDPKKKVVTVKAVHQSSCLTPPALMKLVSAWNKSTPNPSYKIKTSDKSQKDIYESMVKIFKQTNSRLIPEHEWWEQPWVTEQLSSSEIEEIKEEHYAPEAPDSWHQNPTEWLSTLDIDAKLEQYEDKYPEFKYFGATPIDFDLKGPGGTCQVNSLCNINLKQLLKQRTPKKYIGVVFNLDKHNEPGSHWIAMFVNIPKREINYWDSYGIKPPMEVMDLMNKIQKQGLELSPQIKFKKQINSRRHQYKNSECGVYSCNFIIQQLEGNTFEEVVNKIIKDDDMNDERWKFFNK